MMVRALLLLLVAAAALAMPSSARASAYDSDAAMATVECDVCTLLMEAALTSIGQNGTLADLLQLLESGCHILPVPQSWKAMCDEVASEFDRAVRALAQFRIAREYTPFGLCCMAGGICKIPCCVSPNAPEQIHLSVTDDLTEMVVTWTTADMPSNTDGALVQWGSSASALPSSASARTYSYTDGGWVGLLHTATMRGLARGATYYYRVGAPGGAFSEVLSFRTIDEAPEALHLGLIGDMGADIESNETVALLTKHAPQLDLLLHNGDFAYADGWQMRWDLYMRKVQPVTSQLPVMGNPGNHEIVYDFSSYRHRFNFPGNQSLSGTNMYYSYNLPFVHVIHMDTEGEYNTAAMTEEQVQWIKADLAKANQNRDKYPWIIALGHRPLYCTGDPEGYQCDIQAEYLRTMVEDVLVQGGVNVVVGAHRHNYERTFPIYQNKATQLDYIHPKYPVYIVVGNAGCRELIDKFPPTPVPPSWSAFRLGEKGYGTMVFNASHMQFAMHGDSQDRVRDSFVLVK